MDDSDEKEAKNMKNLNKMVSLILALCFVLGLSCPAQAAVNPPAETFSSNYFAGYGAALSDAGGHKLSVTFSTTGMGICDELGVANYAVQKLYTLDDGSTIWADVTGWLTGSTGHNVGSYTFSILFQGVAGETYRVRATFFCQKTFSDGTTGMEHKSYTSPSKSVN